MYTSFGNKARVLSIDWTSLNFWGFIFLNSPMLLYLSAEQEWPK